MDSGARRNELGKANLDVPAKLLEQRLEQGEEAETLPGRQVVGEDDLLQLGVAECVVVEIARQAAGLTSTTSGFTVALKTMRESAARNLAQAEAANAKAKLLRPTRPEQDYPNIAAALATVSGAAPAPTGLSERLAALRLQHGGGDKAQQQRLPPSGG